ncbi:type II toxin-antitoxin system HicB family antitoxin [Streptomyces sp. NBC_00237]|uniref:YlcI/YnfO family protein n=1 Tax=Streptomyces sp. NBC_00237 TaxID=2975687 RepID=UPI00224D2088|nr:YlcI/YnfO family protein [Streptomyces sp. NBC_00237]MCX5200154.1 type II toxin-antitoxin system HicB family antitoxin [Streptomyces sp. NBC_00237]
MDLTPYVDTLRRELAAAAEAGGDEARVLAERLTAPLESAARLALLNVLSDAMGEVTRELAPGSVDVRLRGLDPSFVVTPAPGGAEFGWQSDADRHGGPGASSAPSAPPVPPAAPADADEGGTSRINLRLPTHLKTRAEEAASREGLSLNAWLVRAVGAAVDPSAGSPGPGRSPREQSAGRGRQSFTGWVR